MNDFRFSKQLFWDSNPTSLDAEQHKLYIIERVLTRGDYFDWKTLFNTYGHNEISKHIIHIKSLDPKTLNFVSQYFNIPKTDFKCYTNPYWTELH